MTDNVLKRQKSYYYMVTGIQLFAFKLIDYLGFKH